MKSYRANEHYEVVRGGSRGDGDIRCLVCLKCENRKTAFEAYLRSFPKGSSKSGAGRYNRARAAMVHHLATEHPGSATEGVAPAPR